MRSKVVAGLAQEPLTAGQLSKEQEERPAYIYRALRELSDHQIVTRSRVGAKYVYTLTSQVQERLRRSTESVATSQQPVVQHEAVQTLQLYPPMREVSQQDYEAFLELKRKVMIENVEVNLVGDWTITQFQPSEYKPEEWTVWSFPNRGDWATHIGDYRGNWSPYIPRNLIDRYTKKNDWVCDPMMGSGTTLVEAELLQRNVIGVDVNPDAVMVARDRLNFRYRPLDEDYREAEIRTYVGDARNLNEIDEESVDLIATHPPYAGIIGYSKKRVPGDLSALKIEDFMQEMHKVAKEFWRVLRPGKYCAILIGDTRKHRHYIPIHVGVLTQFLRAGFLVKEDIIKLQHKTKTSRERWRGHHYDFYKIAHEHLYVFRKPAPNDDVNQYKYSRRWW